MSKKNTKTLNKKFFRSLSKKEVAKLWNSLYDEAEEAEKLTKRCETEDGRGVLFCHREEWEYQFVRREVMERARFILVEILDKGKKKS